MKLTQELARYALLEHPGRATTILERLDKSETVRLLERGSPEGAASVIQRLSPHYAGEVFQSMKPARAAKMLTVLPVDIATRVLRRAEEEQRESVLELMEDRRTRAIRRVLRFPESSAGALMDTDVHALPSDLSAREALRRVRRDAQLARYNLYVVDQSQRLVGALNLRELLLARGPIALADLMTRDPHRILATADRTSLLAHPGWRTVHALPVVDEAEGFLGAIRYRVLRRLEEDVRASRGEDADPSEALGEVIAVGARGVLDAFSGATNLEFGRKADGAPKRS